MIFANSRIFKWILVWAAAIVLVAHPQPQAASGIPPVSLNQQAYQLFKSGQYVAGYRQALLAKKQALADGNQKALARALSNLASTTLYLGNSEKALELYLKSLSISQESDDLEGIESTLNNIAGVYIRIDSYAEALKYIEMLPVLNNQVRPDYQRVIAFTALIAVYTHTKDFKKAQQALNELGKIYQDYQNPFAKFYYLQSFAANLDVAKQSEQALQKYQQAEQLAIDNNFEGLQVIAKRHQAEQLLKLNKPNSAKSMANKAIGLAIKLSLKSEMFNLKKIIFEIAKNEKNYKEALKLLEDINQLATDISGEKVKQLAEITRIDRQVKETEDKLFRSTKNQEILTLKLEKQKQYQLIWLAILFALSLSLFFIYYRIASKKEIERQKSLNRQLAELDKIKDRVLTNTSHELRTPLNGIIGLSEVIIQDERSELPNSVLDSIKLIKSSGEQLASVVNDILQMSQLKNQKITIFNVEFNLTELILDVVAICRPLAKKKQLNLIFNDSAQIKEVVQDRGRVQQILLNLIGNAVKFTDSGEVMVQLEQLNGELNIIISDSGIGIPEDKLERVFQGFEQVDGSSSRGYAGSGLGLAISRGLAEALGGHLTLNSKLGVGTQVILTLPSGI